MNLRVTLLQSNLVWENPSQNRTTFAKQINELVEEVDIIVLPEMFTTGFSMNVSKFAETIDGETLQWMIELASKKNTAIAGSLISTDNNLFFNRFLFVMPSGKYFTYDKRHLFRMGEENKHYTKGSKKIIFKYKGWKICPLICYDLRFPVWSRNTKENKYDLLLYVANWPAKRSFAWKNLLPARAIENQCYVAAVNRIGKDTNDILYSGNSIILSPKGETLAEAIDNKSDIITATLSYQQLSDFRNEFPAEMDADTFTIID